MQLNEVSTKDLVMELARRKDIELSGVGDLREPYERGYRLTELYAAGQEPRDITASILIMRGYSRGIEVPCDIK